MSRRIFTGKKLPKKDLNFKNLLLNLLINRILKCGKKELAKKIVYKAFHLIKTRIQFNTFKLIERAIRNASPKIFLKILEIKKRNKRSTKKVPTFLTRFRSVRLGIASIVKYARKRPGKNIAIKLANELIDASKYLGGAVRKKEEMHKIAETSRAFVD